MGHRKTEDFLWRNFIVFFFVDIFFMLYIITSLKTEASF